MDETTAVPPTSDPTAGWYPDPLDDTQLRWWTGQGWSEHTQQHPRFAPPVSAPVAYPSPVAAQAASAQPTYAQPTEYVPMAYSVPGYSSGAYVPLDPRSEPLPGASIGQAFVRFWSKYAVFSGRASRSEYWWWNLIFTVVYVAFLVVAYGLPAHSVASTVVSIGFLFVALAIIIPSYALLVRRLHDANLSGWNLLWAFVPFVGGIILLLLTVRQSDPAGRRFDV
ncbi:DUF805 domain-containing protein [Diaminobutyricibacter sp. McL0608]|uniref:DUF805 domain-containing protein n=1 Tax=Leifsonia sp. McL0608 TaxID=3143537 RepID=UPI0031F3081B